MRKLGIVQGRLSPPVNNQIQSFPLECWQDEFPLCRSLGIECMEWLFKYDNVPDNPLCSDQGIKEMIKFAQDHNVRINAVLADYFMIKKLFGEDKSEVNKSIKMLYFLIGQCSKCHIPGIEIPFVDSSALKTEEIKKEVLYNLRGPLKCADKNNISINLETSLAPGEFREYVTAFKPFKVRINYDMGNSASLGYNPKEEINLLGEFIMNVHIKDRVKGGGTVPLGQGDTDFSTVFSALGKTNYTGNFILETARRDLLENNSREDCVETVKEYINFVRPFLEGFE